MLEPNTPGFAQRQKRLRKKRIPYRVNHRTWWKQELASQQKYDLAVKNLSSVGWQYYCTATDLILQMQVQGYPRDLLTDFLEQVHSRLKFRHWYFGHYHKEQEQNEQFTAVYQNILPLASPYTT